MLRECWVENLNFKAKISTCAVGFAIHGSPPHKIRRTCQQAVRRSKKSCSCFAHLGVGCLIQAVSGRKSLLTCKHDASVFFLKPAVNRNRTGGKIFEWTEIELSCII